MALTKRSPNARVYLEVKHYCLWRGLKKKVDGCDEVEANNPSTGKTVTKYGYRYDTVSGHVVKIEKYDTEKKYSKRYFGFKLHLLDGIETYVLDMPYNSQVLRRFMRIAPNIDWSFPLRITAFKGKKKPGAGVEPTGLWFQQGDETIKAFYTYEEPHGMPVATQDPDTHEWDFKDQHRWLINQLATVIMPAVEKAAKRFVAPIEPDHGEFDDEPDEPTDEGYFQPHAPITDDDVPF